MSIPGQEKYLEDIDRLFPPSIPPEVLELIQERQYQYDECMPSEPEMTADVAALDELWPIKDETLRLTGHVYMSVVDDPEHPEKKSVRKLFVEDELVASLGFNAMYERRFNNETDSEEITRALLGLQFAFEMQTVQTGFFEDSIVQRKVFALPGDVTFNRQTEDSLSLFDRVHHVLPELAAEIDAAMLEATDTSSALLALSGLTVRVDAHLSEGSLKDVNQYINSLVQFDRRVPYHLDFEGKCFAVLPDDPKKVHEAEAKRGAVIATPLNVEVLQTDILDINRVKQADDISFGIRILTSGEDISKDDDTEYIIPLTENLVIRDIRTIVYTAFRLAVNEPTEAEESNIEGSDTATH